MTPPLAGQAKVRFEIKNERNHLTIWQQKPGGLLRE
jgi:hypothetical protein